MTIDFLLSRILIKQADKTFYSFANMDGKRWIMPAHNMRTAMNLYQPSSLKGKIMRKGFPYLHRFKIVCKMLHAERECLVLNEQLYTVLSNAFHCNHLEFSIFCGTPCVHQKITIQVSSGKRITGYCKVSENREIKDIFRHEEKILNELHEKGIENIPQCLYCGSLSSDIDLFVQTTAKSNLSSIDHKWGKRQEDFILTLHEKTRCEVKFEQTDFYQDICYLHAHLSDLKEFDAEAVKKGIEKVRIEYEGKKVNFSVYHADFTPWNMFVEKGKLFVFDFEYAKRTYPAYLDYFHFFMQTSIFEKHRGFSEIWADFERNTPMLNRIFADARLSFLCYLLAVVAQYTKRENGRFSGDVLQNMSIWIALIARL